MRKITGMILLSWLMSLGCSAPTAAPTAPPFEEQPQGGTGGDPAAPKPNPNAPKVG